MKIVCASGYFDPLHIGHIEYLKKAKDLGDQLVVIVNNDKQSRFKKGFCFMNERERLSIIRSLSFVDFALISLDQDKSVCKTLAMLRPDIFAKGGDRFRDNIPEKLTCDNNGIEIVSGLGVKIQSSSNLLSSYKKICQATQDKL